MAHGFVKNTIKGKRRGSKYPSELVAKCLYALIYEPNLHLIAKRYNVPESTLRTWKNKPPEYMRDKLHRAKEEELKSLNFQAARGARLTGDLMIRKLETGAMHETRVEELEAEILTIEQSNELSESEKVEKTAEIKRKISNCRILSPFAASNLLYALTGAAARSSDMLGEDGGEINAIEVNIKLV